MKKLHGSFSILTILTLPIGFYGIYAFYLIESGLADQYLIELNKQLFEFHNSRANKLLQTLDYLALISNLISCVILILLLRVFRKMLAPIKFGRDSALSKQKLNKMVTISHIILILGYTVITSLVLNA